MVKRDAWVTVEWQWHEAALHSSCCMIYMCIGEGDPNKRIVTSKRKRQMTVGQMQGRLEHGRGVTCWRARDLMVTHSFIKQSQGNYVFQTQRLSRLLTSEGVQALQFQRCIRARPCSVCTERGPIRAARHCEPKGCAIGKACRSLASRRHPLGDRLSAVHFQVGHGPPGEEIQAAPLTWLGMLVALWAARVEVG